MAFANQSTMKSNRCVITLVKINLLCMYLHAWKIRTMYLKYIGIIHEKEAYLFGSFTITFLCIHSCLPYFAS